ncbi:recombinase family protein [Deinococcus hopiensis]|uniref:Site-specific DNA recombinase n=1 Tax=Deinococcus hopiensis KR-140 TaxID=695939 RepID=A0A1W1V747_9DEIO|nr:recombinase family protein [Deinococcus hopiensis]SMB89103.1 Site-specific DNA recombinase [Deinococcus hopiensis KR-140]
MTRVLSYGRVSTRDQVDGYSLPAQRERLAAYAQFHGWDTPLHFEDPAISGKRDVRPAWTALMAAFKPGDTVLAKDLSRIARGGIVQTLTIIRDIEARGGRLILIDQSLDTSTPFGRVVLSILATFAEFELEQTRERSLIGRTQAAKSGAWPQGSVPYGYRRNAERRLELNPETMEAARTALRALIGRSYEAAKEHLQEIGLPSPTGKPTWSTTRLFSMAAQTAYIGEAVYTSDGERIIIPCPPLLTREEWALIHAGRDPGHAGGARPEKYPLTGHFRCEHGAPLNGTTAITWEKHKVVARFRTYHVTARLKQSYGCNCTMRRADELEAQTRALLARVLSDPSDPAALRALTAPPDPLADLHAQEREEIASALSNLTRLRVMGQIEERDYLNLREELKGRERALAPKPQNVTLPPAMLELAEDVRASTSEQLAELLDLLEVKLRLPHGGEVELVQFRPLGR